MVGIGSEILSDDGVGLRVTRQLKSRPLSKSIEVLELGTAGLSMLETVKGYNRLIVVDAIQTGETPGTVHVLTGDEVARASHLGPAHEADLPTVLALGRVLADDIMPSEVVVFAIEAGDVTTFSDRLTPQVEAVVLDVVKRIENLCS